MARLAVESGGRVHKPIGRIYANRRGRSASNRTQGRFGDFAVDALPSRRERTARSSIARQMANSGNSLQRTTGSRKVEKQKGTRIVIKAAPRGGLAKVVLWLPKAASGMRPKFLERGLGCLMLSLLTKGANGGTKCQRKALNANGFWRYERGVALAEVGWYGWLRPDSACPGAATTAVLKKQSGISSYLQILAPLKLLFHEDEHAPRGFSLLNQTRPEARRVRGRTEIGRDVDRRDTAISSQGAGNDRRSGQFRSRNSSHQACLILTEGDTGYKNSIRRTMILQILERSSVPPHRPASGSGREGFREGGKKRD